MPAQCREASYWRENNRKLDFDFASVFPFHVLLGHDDWLKFMNSWTLLIVCANVHWPVSRDKGAFLEFCTPPTAIPENKGNQKMEIQFFSMENNRMLTSFGKKLVTL